MVKNICLFNMREPMEHSEFWREHLERHVAHTLSISGHLLAGYVVNRSLQGFTGPAPYALAVELWFRTDADRNQFLQVAGGDDDGFDQHVVDMHAFAVEEIILKSPTL